MAGRYVAYAGTYTLGSSVGIHLYDVDIHEGTLKERKVFPVNNSSHLCLSKNGKFLYSIADEGVAVFAIQPDGDLQKINQINLTGMRGCYLSVDKTGKYLFIAGYHDGKVTLVHTHHDGRLGSEIDGVFHRGLGTVVERNFRPHVSCVMPTRDGKYVCAVDNGIDQVKIYSISDEGKLELADILRCQLGSAPRIIRFSPDGRYAYLICELQNVVQVLAYHPERRDNIFEEIQTISTVANSSEREYDATSSMCFAKDGAYLFVSVAGDNSTTMFKVDQETGLLTREFTLPISGNYPKDIRLFPGGDFLASVNHESGSITTFKIDYEKNLIVMKGKPVRLDTPNCIVFTEVAG
ncbi:MAG: lactonase family protein [Eubacterium sp.]|nr:lactonase family protein [Eubacterium sp.]